MAKVTRKHWERVPDLIDHTTKLTDHEDDLIYGAVMKVVQNIFRREKDPLKRRILVDRIPKIADIYITSSVIAREGRHKQKILRKMIKK